MNKEGFNLSRSKPIEGNGIFIIGQEQDNIGGKFNNLQRFGAGAGLFYRNQSRSHQNHSQLRTSTNLCQKPKNIFFPFQQVDSVNQNHSLVKFLSSTSGIGNSTQPRSANIIEHVTRIKETFIRGLI